MWYVDDDYDDDDDDDDDDDNNNNNNNNNTRQRFGVYSPQYLVYKYQNTVLRYSMADKIHSYFLGYDTV
jgi:hypothetical protein